MADDTRWWLAVLVVVAGCGRIDFDVRADAETRGFDHPSFTTCDDSLALVGVANCTNGNIELTSATMSVAGAVWAVPPIAITPTTRFSMEAAFVFTPTGTGADGVALVVQASSQGSDALGVVGSGLGYYGIVPSLVLEVDPFQNTWDAYSNELAFVVGGDATVAAAAAPASPIGFANGLPFHVWFDYDANTQRAEAFVSNTGTKPPTPLVMVTDDLTRLGGQAWFGVTASTGQFVERQELLAWKLVVMP